MEINYEDLIETIFNKPPGESKSITLDFVERLSLNELFEFLISYFTDGSKILFGEIHYNKVIVDLNKWENDPQRLDKMKKYFKMIGFNLLVNIEDYDEKKNYNDLMYNNININQETKLSELNMFLKNKNKVYNICFEFI